MKPKIANLYGATLTNPWSYGGFYWSKLSLIIGGSWDYGYDFYLPEKIAEREKTLATVTKNIQGLKKANPNINILSYLCIDYARPSMVDELLSGWVIGTPDAWGNIKIDTSEQDPLVYNLNYLRTGQPDIFDGVFYDCWHIDDYLISETRKLFPDKKLMFNNWSLLRDPINRNLVDGAVAEDEINRVVEGKVDFNKFVTAYLSWCKETRQPTLTTIVASGTEDNFKMMRFGLCTTLLGDGYYAYDAGFSRGDWWWYKEYDVELGTSAFQAYQTPHGIWKRSYNKAIVLVNGTNEPKPFKFGRRMTDISTGKTVKSITLEAFDGRIFV